MDHPAAISIHAPREGSDANTLRRDNQRGIFQSTLPARGATDKNQSNATIIIFQSTLPARGATVPRQHGQNVRHCISIHAPREGSDGERRGDPAGAGISIHAPREGSDCWSGRASDRRGDFNPRSPRGERQERRRDWRTRRIFQSTLPARGATDGERLRRCIVMISIHAPREGSDKCFPVTFPSARFQSTLPARGATSNGGGCAEGRSFQSTLPARGATAEDDVRYGAPAYFNPRSPRGERRRRAFPDCGEHPDISIHAPREGSDATDCAQLMGWRFQSTLPARGATHLAALQGRKRQFQSTLPARGATHQER